MVLAQPLAHPGLIQEIFWRQLLMRQLLQAQSVTWRFELSLKLPGKDEPKEGAVPGVFWPWWLGSFVLAAGTRLSPKPLPGPGSKRALQLQQQGSVLLLFLRSEQQIPNRWRN